MVEITFKNKTPKITTVEVIVNNTKFIFKGDKAKEIAKMSNSDMPGIKTFIENLLLNT